MSDIELWLQVLGRAFVSLLIQPFFYISFALIIVMLLYRVRMERSMFSVKLSDWKYPMFSMFLGGVLAALVVSILAVVLGFSVTAPTLYWLWAIMIILGLFRVKFLSLVYSASIVALLHLIAAIIGPLSLPSYITDIYQSLLDIDVVSLLVISSMLTIAQAILIRIHHKHIVTPVYVSGIRGKVVGGYVLQGFWPAPLLLFMPVASGTNVAFVLDAQAAQPFFLDTSHVAWLLLACPLMIGTTQLTKVLSPKQLAMREAKQSLFIGLGALLLAISSWWIHELAWATAILLLGSTEGLYRYNQWKEASRAPAYGQSSRGLKVLATIKDSPSQMMGIQAGDIIVKANGKPVHSLEQLYEAMSSNSAYCKLDLLDSQQELKFASRTRYADEHHQLGIILVPDEQSKFYDKYVEPSILTWLRKAKVMRNRKDTYPGEILPKIET